MDLTTLYMIIVIGLCIGMIGYLIKSIIQKSSSDSLLINRYLILGLLMLIYMVYCLCYNKIDIVKDFSVSKYEILGLVACTIIIFSLESFLYKKHQVSDISPFIILSALLSSVLIGKFIYNDKISNVQYMAYTLIIIGLIILANDKK